MRNRKGVALVTALMLILMLGAVATEVTRSAYSVSDTADNLRSRAIARYAAESGVILAAGRIEEFLAKTSDSVPIKRYLNTLQQSNAGVSIEKLGNARMQVAIVDANSRLDVNSASAEQLMTLFSAVAALDESRRAALAIRNRIEFGSLSESFKGSVPAGIARPPFATPLRSLEELAGIRGVSAKLAEASAPYLTVDGDGRINKVTAGPQVIAAAGGELRDYPSRLVIISRGWNEGRPLTFEIQAVYALEYGKLVLVKWRERDL